MKCEFMQDSNSNLWLTHAKEIQCRKLSKTSILSLRALVGATQEQSADDRAVQEIYSDLAACDAEQ